MDIDISKIDWTVFDRWSESTVYCRCETAFRSHAKFIIQADGSGLISRKPCPDCGRHDSIWKTSSDPEFMTIGGETK
jgi:hypothetical protein